MVLPDRIELTTSPLPTECEWSSTVEGSSLRQPSPLAKTEMTSVSMGSDVLMVTDLNDFNGLTQIRIWCSLRSLANTRATIRWLQDAMFCEVRAAAVGAKRALLSRRHLWANVQEQEPRSPRRASVILNCETAKFITCQMHQPG